MVNIEDLKKKFNKVNLPALSTEEQQLGNVPIPLIPVCILLKGYVCSLKDWASGGFVAF